MNKTIIIYNGMLFSSPRHLMNHFRNNNDDNGIDIKYLTQCVYKGIETVKGVDLKYRTFNLDIPEMKEAYRKIKSLTRTGKGFVMGMSTPIDYFETVIKPLMEQPRDPVKAAIERAVNQGIGTEKDYEDLIKKESK